MATTVQAAANMMEQKSVLEDLGEEVTGIMAPVSICMAITVLLVRVLNPEGQSSSATVYIASLAYDEQAGDSAGQKLGGALLNAVIFVAIVAGMTFVLFLLFKYKCYRLIYGYMGVAMFNIFFFLTGTVALRLLQTIHLHMDAFSFCYLLFNFSVVGVLGLFFFPIPLFMKQCYLVWVGVVTAFIFTYIPEWTAWVLLVLMAVYDLIAVLVPGGPLKILVELAIERNQELPALIYESRPTQRPYNRGMWRPPAPGEQQQQQGSAAAGEQPAQELQSPMTPSLPPVNTTTAPAARRGLFGGLFGGRGSGPAASGSPTFQTALLSGSQSDSSSPAAGTNGGQTWGEVPTSAAAGRGRPLGEGQEGHIVMLDSRSQQPVPQDSTMEAWMGTTAAASRVAAVGLHQQAGSRGSSRVSSGQQAGADGGQRAEGLLLAAAAGPLGEGTDAPDLPGMPQYNPSPSTSPGPWLPGQPQPSSGGGMQPVAADASPLRAGEGVSVLPPAAAAWLAQGGAAAAPDVGATSMRNRSRPVSAASDGAAVEASGRRPPSSSPQPGSFEQDTSAGGAAGPPAAPGSQEGSEEYGELPDGIKLGLGDFIFYSMLVGRAAMYDMMTVFASYLAIIAGLGTTLLLLALARKALPALPVSIVLGVMFYFLTRFTLEPFLVPLAINQAYY